MKNILLCCLLILGVLFGFRNKETTDNVIRINLLGYQPGSVKVAVWGSFDGEVPQKFELVEETSGKTVFSSDKITTFGAYGPFKQTARLNFSAFRQSGRFIIKAGAVQSPVIIINDTVYRHAADFCLRYMRQQRSKFNPFLKDSCHTHDGFALYGGSAGIKDSTFFDASGGWHDASDYLQYASTSANAAYHLLAAYRDFPGAFGDEKLANGLDGTNGTADILDEARWGLEWLVKMHPKANIMFNQLADDRDHIRMRMPAQDSQYGKGFERPLYFITGAPQQRGKFMNNTTGTSSTAAKFTSAFSLGYQLFKDKDATFAKLMKKKAGTAYRFALKKPGVTQTVSVLSPYIYAEDNWVDDMELATAELANMKPAKGLLNTAFNYAEQEKVTPWMGKDTASHYQYYPFHNFGHYAIATADKGDEGKATTGFYREGIEKVWQKARNNAFYRGIPFIWCSNNLTASFTIQTYLYKELTNDTQFDELAQANFDWLFGCNIWGTSMVYGLPAWGDTPTDPHSAFTHIGKFPIDGGLVDGPVYGNIYKSLLGIKLTKPDDYAKFQSDLVVYHDDYGDYSTNEPTMDGTASLVYLLAAFDSGLQKPEKFRKELGAITRGDVKEKKLSIVFTGDEFGDGGEKIASVLQQQKVKASFFLTGRFYRNPDFAGVIKKLKKEGNYLGSHSDQHLLYNDWTKRDSMLVTEQQFKADLSASYRSMARYGIKKQDANYFLPPYEWHNKTVADWTATEGLTLVNYSSGTRSNADYTYPEMGKSYRPTEEILQSIYTYDKEKGLNGFILLIHIGTDPRRTDKLYNRLDELINYLKQNGYAMVTIDKLLEG